MRAHKKKFEGFFGGTIKEALKKYVIEKLVAFVTCNSMYLFHLY